MKKPDVWADPDPLDEAEVLEEEVFEDAGLDYNMDLFEAIYGRDMVMIEDEDEEAEEEEDEDEDEEDDYDDDDGDEDDDIEGDE